MDTVDTILFKTTIPINSNNDITFFKNQFINFNCIDGAVNTILYIVPIGKYNLDKLINFSTVYVFFVREYNITKHINKKTSVVYLKSF